MKNFATLSDHSGTPRTDRGFSLIELLIVIALIGILSAFAMPAFNAIGGSHAVTRDGQLINDQFNLARQTAITRNRETELRIIEYPGDKNQTNWALVVCEAESGTPLQRLALLGDNVVINPNLSPLLDKLKSEKPAVFPTLGNNAHPYYALKFRPNGRVKGNFPPQQDYITLHLRRDDPDEPKNYYTLQIQSVTGRISSYRP